MGYQQPVPNRDVPVESIRSDAAYVMAPSVMMVRSVNVAASKLAGVVRTATSRPSNSTNTKVVGIGNLVSRGVHNG